MNLFKHLSYFLLVLLTSLFLNCLGAGRSGFDSSGVNTKSENFANTLLGIFLFDLSKDKTPPTLDSVNIKNNFTIETGKITGTTSDNVAVASVYININSNGYQIASGTNSFTYNINGTIKWLGAGNSINIKVIDTSGNETISTYTNIKKGENKDVNGDGYSDLVISASNYNSAQGRVYVFHGSAAGITGTGAASANTILSGNSSKNNSFGSSFAMGDINGDGYSDLVVCGKGNMNASPNQILGGIYIYKGSETGNSNSADWSKEESSTSQDLCTSVVVQDFNNDGYDDIAVSLINYIASPNSGKIEFYYGSSSGLDLSTPSKTIVSSGTSNMGGSLIAGDVNGDGYIDLIATSSGSLPGLLFLGSSTGITATNSSGAAITWTDSTVFSYAAPLALGDINGDSKLDLMVGNSSACYVFLNQGSTNAYLTTTSFSLSGTCSSVTSKDIDEDGFDDIFVSNTSYAAPPNSNSGQVNIYKGKSTWSGTNSPNTQITGTNNGYKFGSKVSLMDINNDNILDLIVSEPYAVSGAAAGVGRVLIFHNSSSKDFSGISYSSPNLTIQGESAGSNFGSYLLY